MYTDEVRRLVMKSGSGVPTVPVSADHRNGDWLDNDIYDGEIYRDIDTGILYSREGSLIYELSRSPIVKRLLVTVTQTATSAPVLTILTNTFPITPATVYDGVGSYRITSMTGQFPVNKTVVLCTSYAYGTGSAKGLSVYRDDDDNIAINSYLSEASANDVLFEDTILIEVYP